MSALEQRNRELDLVYTALNKETHTVVTGIHDKFRRKSCMACTTDGRAFGPTFKDDRVFDFLDWVAANGKADPRTLDDETLDELVAEWEGPAEPGDIEIYGAGVKAGTGEAA